MQNQCKNPSCSSGYSKETVTSLKSITSSNNLYLTPGVKEIYFIMNLLKNVKNDVTNWQPVPMCGTLHQGRAVHVRSLHHKTDKSSTWGERRAKGWWGGGRRVNQSTGSQKPKMISLVDIWMLGMPWMAAVHFWLCLCGDE